MWIGFGDLLSAMLFSSTRAINGETMSALKVLHKLNNLKFLVTTKKALNKL